MKSSDILRYLISYIESPFWMSLRIFSVYTQYDNLFYHKKVEDSISFVGFYPSDPQLYLCMKKTADVSSAVFGFPDYPLLSVRL